MAVLDGAIDSLNSALNGAVEAQEAVLEGALDYRSFDMGGEIGRSATWGLIDGDINDQTDLINLIGTKADTSSFTSHVQNTSNPHSVTKAQIGLGNVDNTSDLDKPISTATQAALDGKVDDVKVNGYTVVSDGEAIINIKTINAQSLVGTGNIDIEGGSSSWNALDDKPFSSIDTTTLKVVNGVLMVNTTDEMTEDDARPITSDGVHTVVGNIEALLEVI